MKRYFAEYIELRPGDPPQRLPFLTKCLWGRMDRREEQMLRDHPGAEVLSRRVWEEGGRVNSAMVIEVPDPDCHHGGGI